MIKVYQLRKLQNSYQVVLNYKGVKVKVSFKDGNTYKGIYPKLYTNDVFKQRAIENSQPFKDKEIVLERQIEEESDRQALRRSVVKPAVQKTSGRAVKTNGRKDGGSLKTNVGKDDAAEAVPAGGGVSNATDGTDDGVKTFANLGEAVMFVAQTYGVSAQTEKEVRKVLKDHGVEAKIKKG